MQIRAIKTGEVAIKQRQLRGVGRGPARLLNTLRDHEWTSFLPIYAWLIEHPEGLILVDTGETARTQTPGYFPRWNPYYQAAVRERIQPEEEIGPQLRAHGFSPNDVRWVILTHVHTDHAGGLSHFPHAEILLTRAEYDQAAGLAGQIRGALPQHWPNWFAPRLIQFRDTPLGPFPHTFPLTAAGDIALLPTPGHTLGHMSVVVRDGEQLVFLAGDTSYTQQLMLENALDGVSMYEQLALQTHARIQMLAREQPLVYLPSHDPDSAARLAARTAVVC